MNKRFILTTAVVLILGILIGFGAAAFYMTEKRGDAAASQAGMAEASAELSTEPVTESSTEISTEPSTELSTESSTELSTEPSTEPVTETAGKPGAKPTTETAGKPDDKPTTETTGKPDDKPSTETAEKPDDKPSTETAALETEGRKKANSPSGNSYYGALHVNGTQLEDGEGRPVQLRGISTHGLAWFPEYVNEAMIRQLHDEWNANIFRLAMYTAESGGYCTGGDKSQLKQLVKDGVQYATDAGMYVIIDWHILSDGNPNQYKSEAKDFFEEMSQTFASYENVLYEICNEPNGGTGWGDVKAYAEEIIPVIRKNAPEAVILVGTPNWCQFVDQAAKDPITGYDNIMYTLHFYAATHTDALRNTMVSAINAGLPVFVSEYGICDASGNGRIDEDQANKWVSLLNEYGVSYVLWSICNKNEAASIIDSSCSKTSGLTEADLAASGKWVYHMLTGGNGRMPADAPSDSTQSQSDAEGQSTKEEQSPESGLDKSSGSNPQADASPGSAAALTNEDLEITSTLAGTWESNGQHFYQYTLTLKNCSGKVAAAWAVDVKFSQEFSLSDKWNGNYAVDGSVLHITSMDYNGNLAAGASVSDIGFIVSGSEKLKIE